MSWVGRLGAAAFLVLVACGGPKARKTDAGAGPSDANDNMGGMTADAASPPDAGLPDAAAAPPTARTTTVSGAVKSQSPRFKLFGTVRSGETPSGSERFEKRGTVSGGAP